MPASAEGRPPDEQIKMTVSERSLDALAVRLQHWLAGRLAVEGQAPGGGRARDATGVRVSGARLSGSGGLSSTSVLFEASWVSGGAERHGAYVARMAPGGERGAGVPALRPGRPVRGDQPGGRAQRRPAAGRCAGTSRTAGRSARPFFVMDQVDGPDPAG